MPGFSRSRLQQRHSTSRTMLSPGRCVPWFRESNILDGARPAVGHVNRYEPAFIEPYAKDGIAGFSSGRHTFQPIWHPLPGRQIRNSIPIKDSCVRPHVADVEDAELAICIKLVTPQSALTNRIGFPNSLHYLVAGHANMKTPSGMAQPTVMNIVADRGGNRRGNDSDHDGRPNEPAVLSQSHEGHSPTVTNHFAERLRSAAPRKRVHHTAGSYRERVGISIRGKPRRLGASLLWLWASCCRTSAISRSQPADYPHRRTSS
jgi:hypothetical protein